MQFLTLVLVVLINVGLFPRIVYTANDDESNPKDVDPLNYIEILCMLQPTFAFCKKLNFPKILSSLTETGNDFSKDSFWSSTLEEYDNSGTSGALNRKRIGFLSLDGLGSFSAGKTSEQTAGLTDVVDTVSSFFFPYALLPRLQKLEQQETLEKRKFDDVDLNRAAVEHDSATEQRSLESSEEEQKDGKVYWYSEEYKVKDDDRSDIPQSLFDRIQNKLLAKSIDSKKFGNDENFDHQSNPVTDGNQFKKARALHSKIHKDKPKTLSDLGLTQEEIQTLCKKFEPFAEKYCFKPKIDQRFIDKCRGYAIDCIIGNRGPPKSPLAATANAFSSNVGVTYNYFGVNGIPYYPINDEGSVHAGQSGKVDFGSWGGGYTDDLSVRDYFRQKTESGGNWYEGIYGYKTGWSVPIVEQFGVEGGGGTQASVPLNEHQVGSPLQFSTGYHVGPYVGVLNDVGVDWYKGVVSTKRAFASPIVGVSGSSSSGFAFPSLELFMKHFGLGDYLAPETEIPSSSG